MQIKYNIRKIRKNLEIIKILKHQKTVVCKNIRYYRIPKYNRYIIKMKKFHVHIPVDYNTNNLKIGDKINIGETRRISKIKSHILL